jgi:hypothetical protein
MKKIIKNSKNQFNHQSPQSDQSAFQDFIQLLIYLSLSFALIACGSHPNPSQDENTLMQKQRLPDIQQDEVQVQDMGINTSQDVNNEEAKKAKMLALKAQCISQKIENITFTSVLEDTQKYVLQFIQFYEMISKNGPNLELILQRSQYLIQFNQSLFKYLQVIETFARKCDPSVFDFIEYRKQLTDYIDGVIQKNR